MNYTTFTGRPMPVPHSNMLMFNHSKGGWSQWALQHRDGGPAHLVDYDEFEQDNLADIIKDAVAEHGRGAADWLKSLAHAVTEMGWVITA